MPVCLSSKTWERLQTNQLKQTVCESHNVANWQRENVVLHKRLPGELKRQILFQENKKRVLTTSILPVISRNLNYEGFSQKRMHFKTVKNRVSSDSKTPSSNMVCSRRVTMQDDQLGRHFCELLGPQLCVDCIRARERVEALKENEETPASFHLEREPFTALVASHLNKQRDLDEMTESFDDDSLNQDTDLDELTNIQQSSRAVSKIIFSPSPPGTGDSGFSSRLSRIRGFTRAQSCSTIRNFVPFSPLRREKTHAPRIRKSTDSRTSSGFGSPSRGLSREFSSDSFGFLSTIEKLQQRTDQGRYEMDVSRAWSKTPVEPILMELRLINFTDYTELGYRPPEPEPEPQPDIERDEFGFPIMDNLSMPTIS